MQRDVTAMKVIVQPFLGVRAMTSSGAHENGLKQKLANLLETIAHPWPGELITEGDEQLGDFFSCLCHCATLATCVPPCRHDQIVADHPSTVFHP